MNSACLSIHLSMILESALQCYRVGQSREIWLKFGSTFATTLAISEVHPTTLLAGLWGRVIDPKQQIVYLPHMTRSQFCSKMWSVEGNQWN